MSLTENPKVQAGCLSLICVPFFIGGTAASILAGRMAVSPTANWLSVFARGAFGLTFSLAGLAILYGLARARRKQEKLAQMRASYPQSPWMWREDWSQGRVQSTTHSGMVQAWVFAVIWNLISSPLLFLLGPKAWTADRKILLAMLFPVVGFGLLVWAVRETVRWEKFGKTWFDLTTLPGVIGGELRGAIHTRLPSPPQDGLRLKLSCVNRTVTGSGDNRSVSEKILWRDESVIPSDRVASGPVGSVIPVAFRIPVDALETDTEAPDNSILWVLEADAKEPGVDYKDLFEVPVFRTKESPAPEQPQAAPFSMVTSAPLEKPADSRIVVRPADIGGVEYDFSAARNPGAASSTTIFFILWTAVAAFLFKAKIPLIFPVVFGLFDVLLLAIVLSLWLGTSKVVIGSSRIIVHRGILGIGPSRSIPCSEVSQIEMPIGMQTGGRSGVPFYDIRLGLRNGRNVTLASAIRNKLEAEWLISRMKNEIGLK